MTRSHKRLVVQFIYPFNDFIGGGGGEKGGYILYESPSAPSDDESSERGPTPNNAGDERLYGFAIIRESTAAGFDIHEYGAHHRTLARLVGIS